MEGRDVAGDKSTACDLGADVCFEDETGQGVRPLQAVPELRSPDQGLQPSVHGIYPGPGIVPGPQVLRRHGDSGNLVVGRRAVTAAVHADSPTLSPTCVPLYPVISVLVCFSFLILIGSFATLVL